MMKGLPLCQKVEYNQTRRDAPAATQNLERIDAMKTLNNDQLMKSAPSIFTQNKSAERSERYTHLPTIAVIDDLRRAGFVPVQAFESRVHRNADERAPFTKHLVRLRERKYADGADTPKVGDSIPEILLTNAHNGTSSFKLEAGLYRLVCSNGLVICSDKFDSIRVPHTAAIFDRIREGATHLAKMAPEILRVTKAWDKIDLTPRQRNAMAKAALELRFHGAPSLTVEQALENRRNADEAPTLWRTYNTLQENLLMGGQIGRTPRGRSVTTRAVSSVNNSLMYNRGLWQLAETAAKKAA